MNRPLLRIAGASTVALLCLSLGQPAPASVLEIPVVGVGNASVGSEPVTVTAEGLAELLEAHPEAFSAYYFDPKADQYVLAATAAGEDLARSLPEVQSNAVRILSVRHSHDELMAIQRDLVGRSKYLSSHVLMGAVDSTGAGITFTVTSLSAVDVAEVRSMSPVRVTFVIAGAEASNTLYENRQTDQSPYSGGMAMKRKYVAGGSTYFSNCSSGFGFQLNSKEFLLTAGHCSPYDTPDAYKTEYERWGFTEVVAGALGNRSTWIEAGNGGTRLTGDGDYHGDVALINVTDSGNAAGSQIWSGTATSTTKLPVTSRHSAVIGWNVCYSGATTGEKCGALEVYDVNVDAYYYDAGVPRWRARNVDYVVGSPGGCSDHGDSGAPVFQKQGSSVKAVGVLSGGGANQYACWLYSTGVEEAIQAWGGDLDFN